MDNKQWINNLILTIQYLDGNNEYFTVKYWDKMIPKDIVVVISQYLDYINRINIAKINKKIYKRIYPKIRYIVYWEDDVSPSDYSENIYLCETKKDAIEKYQIANKNIEQYGKDGSIMIDIFIDGKMVKYYGDNRLTKLHKIISTA